MMPNLQRSYEEYKDRVDFIAIDCDESRDVIEAYLKEKNNAYTFPIGYDPAGKTILGLGITGFPTTIFVAADKTVSDIAIGACNDEEFKKYIEKLLVK